MFNFGKPIFVQFCNTMNFPHTERDKTEKNDTDDCRHKNWVYGRFLKIFYEVSLNNVTKESLISKGRQKVKIVT